MEAWKVQYKTTSTSIRQTSYWVRAWFLQNSHTPFWIGLITAYTGKDDNSYGCLRVQMKLGYKIVIFIGTVITWLLYWSVSQFKGTNSVYWGKLPKSHLFSFIFLSFKYIYFNLMSTNHLPTPLKLYMCLFNPYTNKNVVLLGVMCWNYLLMINSQSGSAHVQQHNILYSQWGSRV